MVRVKKTFWNDELSFFIPHLLSQLKGEIFLVLFLNLTETKCMQT